LGFEAIHLCQDAGQFFLEILFGLLVVMVAEFADAVFELKVAEILVNGGFTFVQMGEGRNGFGFGEVLGANAQDKHDDDNCDNAGDSYEHRQSLAANERE